MKHDIAMLFTNDPNSCGSKEQQTNNTTEENDKLDFTNSLSRSINGS
jgi:hypothetical protein